jgi:hypothetical protein
MATKKAEKETLTESKQYSNICIEQPKVNGLCLEVEGVTDIIQNCFCQKTIEQMLRKHMGLSVQKENKVPRECVENATIRNIKREVCLPPVAFKCAMLTASMQIKGMMKSRLRPILFIEGQSIPITYEKMVPRMDMVRTATGMPDVRFRPMFVNWKARLCIQFADTLPPQTVVDLLNRAGKVGVGEWRPERNGTFGIFKVVRNITDSAEVAEVRDLCSTPLVQLVIPEWAMDAEISDELMQRIAVGQATRSSDSADSEDEGTKQPDVEDLDIEDKDVKGFVGTAKGNGSKSKLVESSR